MEQVLNFLDSINPLEDGLRSFLKNNLRKSTPQKGAILLQEGTVARHINFIEKGIIRAFRSGNNDKERTTWFMMENDVFISIRSFLKQMPAKETIETLEPCLLYGLTFPLLQEALRRYPSFHFHRAEILEKYYLLNEEREDMRQEANKFDAFCYLMENYPKLVGRVQDKYLASFINVRPSYFSELKDKYLEQKKNKP